MLGVLILVPALLTGVVQVSIQNFSFVPDSVRVQPGDTVRWTNSDVSAHTSTGTGTGSAAWNSGNLSQGQTYQRVFTANSVLDYRCNIHTTMVGRVYVGNATAITPMPAKTAHTGHGAGHEAAPARDTRGRTLNPEQPPVTGSPAFTPPQ